MKSSGSHIDHVFSQVPSADIPRSRFDRSHGLKTAFNPGFLVPVLVDEVLPGDTYNVKISAFGRLATLLYPILDNVYLDIHCWFCPNRLVWTNWEKLNGAQTNPGDSTDYLVPKIVAPSTGYAEGSIFDYMGLPTKLSASYDHSALPLRAYNRIWNEFYRDENLQTRVAPNSGDGPDLYTDYTLLRRGKRHDYFTACLPWPQKGTAVSLPLGSTAPVIGSGIALGLTDTVSNFALKSNNGSSLLGTATASFGSSVGSAATTTNLAADKAIGVTTTPASSGLIADLSTATAATINQLRQAFQLQRLFERDARGGTRYIEILKSHFGVISPDFRLQRPEYLGGITERININTVAQTAPTAGNSVFGGLSAFATASTNGSGFVKSFTEHGIILVLASVRAEMTYQQGLHRMWSRRTRFDHYWPALAHLGEQSVLNKEIYCKGDANDSLVFGYQEAWAEYRYKPSIVTGVMRSNATTPLDAWHLALNFTSLPVLNSTFIQENPPLSRVSAVPSQPQLLMDFHFFMNCARPMPVYSVPGMIDHF